MWNYWRVIAVVAVPVVISSAIDKYWIGVFIGVVLFARGVYGWRSGRRTPKGDAELTPDASAPRRSSHRRPS